MKQSLIFMSLLALSTVFVSCKKDDPKPSCKIITLMMGGDPLNISYQADGKIAMITQGTSISSYTYSGSTVSINTTNAGVFDYKQIITVLPNGLASNARMEYNEAGTQWENTVYDYNGTQLIQSTTSSSLGGAVDVVAFSWTNGNMTSIIQNGDIDTYTYNTSEPSKAGDYLYIANLTQGYETYRSKNLLTSGTSGGTVSIFSYGEDANGYITSITVSSGGAPATYNYQLQCN